MRLESGRAPDVPTNGDVDTGFDEVHVLVGDVLDELHARVLQQEVTKDLGQGVARQAHGAGQANASREGAAVAPDLGLRGLHFVQRGAGTPVEGLADVGDHELARRSMDEPHTESLLELPHVSAEQRLRQRERPTGRREAALLHDVGEVEVVVEIELHRAPPSFHSENAEC